MELPGSGEQSPVGGDDAFNDPSQLRPGSGGGGGYFNDLSQQIPSHHHPHHHHPPHRQHPHRTDSWLADDRRASQDENGQLPKTKRIACVLCRKRKLKCNGAKPSCETCVRLQHDCSYDEVRRKSGPKRGYVKALEARLAQVETLLKTQDDAPLPPSSAGAGPGATATGGKKRGGGGGGGGGGVVNMSAGPEFENIAVGSSNVDMLPHLERTAHQHEGPVQAQYPHSLLATAGSGDAHGATEEFFPWEMIGLGLDEPLPTQDVVDDLNQAYFDKIHPSLPMIHRPRYCAAMNLAPHMRPPVCLRYAMWCNAAAVTDKYEGLQEHFYHRARKYIQQDEMKGHGEGMITVAHAQTWVLLGTYEFKRMYFPRAWMSAGRSCRLTQMMGLHRLDGAGLDVKQCLPPPRDWTEREERRRTFWGSFCIDRYSSIGTGWPMTIEETDIRTTLPCDEEPYERSAPCRGMTLADALDPSGAPDMSSFAGVIFMACLFGRNLTHLHRPGPADEDDNLNGEFWKRHRHMDNILLNTALALPDPLRLPAGLNNPNTVFMNMNIHTSTICLHQAAIFKADKNRMPPRVSAESKVRCITAAAEIANIMRQISHLDLSTMNPFISFCLYVAARVFVQYLKSRPKDAQVKASLQFLLSAMHAIKRKNPLTESFLVQLDVDLEGAGLEDLRMARPSLSASARVSGCSPGSRTEQLGVSAIQEQRHPTYGDQGLAAYNVPGKDAPPLAENPVPFGYMSTEMKDYTLPNRQRTPASLHGPASVSAGSGSGAGGGGGGGGGGGAYCSPQDNFEMDTTPDGSGGHLTPSSKTHSMPNGSSHHSSTTAYSPQGPQQQQQQQQQQQELKRANGPPPDANAHHGNNAFALPTAAFTPTDFDLFTMATENVAQQQQQQQQAGFVLPQNWGTSGAAVGLPTPGGAPSGLTPAGPGEFMAMTDADWDQVLDGFPAWDPGLGHGGNANDLIHGRRT